MAANPFLGVFLHSVGGLAAGSFYVPFRKVRQWAWESYWLIQGVAAWVLMPSLMAYITCPRFVDVLRASPWQNILLAYLFGAVWGVGGLTFGLSMRYLGLSLGYAVALGFCAAAGFTVPPIFEGKAMALVASTSGLTIVGGAAISMLGIVVCGMAGIRKERELTAEQARATIKEFALVKGFAVAIFAGVMSSFMAFAIAASGEIDKVAQDYCSNDIFQGLPGLVVIMAGGFTVNFVWCLILNLRNRTTRDYVSGGKGLPLNYLLSGLAGVIWYFQFFFYTMGSTRLGEYRFSSWPIHMSFIIVFSNLWGIYFKEWKGTSRRTHALVWAGILILAASTFVIGYGNHLKSFETAGQ